jgi:hypothetical protein
MAPGGLRAMSLSGLRHDAHHARAQEHRHQPDRQEQRAPLLGQPNGQRSTLSYLHKIAVDVATRTICAAVLRPVGTKAVDASLLLARMLVPEPMRPGWSGALAMSASLLPHGRLLDIDARMEAAAAKPVIVPDGVVIDGGRVFISETFLRACERLGISVQRARPYTPTDKAVVEATSASINMLFTQFLAGYTGRSVDRRGRAVEQQPAWTVPELQELLDEWLIIWQQRPRDALRDPLATRRMLTPNERYAALVAVCGYLPLVLHSEDYLELLPVKRRVINAYGIRVDHRTYDCADLGPYRRQHSGDARHKGLWEVHYDPYELSQVFLRRQGRGVGVIGQRDGHGVAGEAQSDAWSVAVAVDRVAKGQAIHDHAVFGRCQSREHLAIGREEVIDRHQDTRL